MLISKKFGELGLFKGSRKEDVAREEIFFYSLLPVISARKVVIVSLGGGDCQLGRQ